MTTKEQIEAILAPYDRCPLECDGFTRIASYLLNKHKIAHQTMGGYATWRGKVVSPHWWIQVGSLVVDYRLRMWCGPDAPHGVVEGGSVEYMGDPSPMQCNDVIFEILTGRVPDEV